MRARAKTDPPPFRALILAAGLLFLSFSPSFAGPVVSIEPMITIVDPNDLFDVAIRIDDAIDTISNFQVFFDFNDAVIEFQEAIEGSLYTESGNQTWFFFSESPPGTVEVFDVIFPAQSFLLTPGELARLRFRALADGVSEIRFFSVVVEDIDRELIPGLASRNGTVCVGEASTGVPGEGGVSRNWEIGFPFPNPARGETRLRLVRPAQGRNDPFRLGVFDISGRLVRAIEGTVPIGSSEIVWDGRDRRGAPAPPGVYFFRFETGGESISKKVILVR